MNILHLNLPMPARLDRSTPDHSQAVSAEEPCAITERLHELEDEWTIENLLEAGAVAVCVVTLALGLAFDHRWFALPLIVSALLLQQVLQGWCPLLPLLRGLGFRTDSEIRLERHALEQSEQEQTECHRSGWVMYEAPARADEQPTAIQPTCEGAFSLKQFLLTGAQ